MIFAAASTNPGSSASNAPIVQHDSHGSTQMDLSQAVGTTGQIQSQGGASSPWTRYDSLIVIHGRQFSLLRP
jgi:hypothetical protein